MHVALLEPHRGRESVLGGQSGRGKSSLLNALGPGLNLRIGEISAKWDTGKHTTRAALVVPVATGGYVVDTPGLREVRSEEHTSELQSQSNLVCRLLLEKKKKKQKTNITDHRNQILLS